ncbi:MAG: hypothetical protein IKP56_00075 [Bacilli bacterium]|nr:hypothetical protein [Bacilli bacterium]
MKKRVLPILFALMAASFYAINIPLSKLLLDKIEPTLMEGAHHHVHRGLNPHADP